ncbi:UNKNOWN [Stylonychia lemnae]|uniref:CHHC U11-48K-type domain-containing protein n=1 Tax=Stylonychia lemnae TaxID=5949 RepID=A0A078AL06_STYLE|nr:UNKNOWN [Stylonychia lemnae]|eukprot:CDW83050.1 UNKNOWN [Stylonychia lemnae]
MRRYDDPKIICPFDKSHIMPSIRFTWHMKKCKDQYLVKNPTSTVWHCKYHYLHIYFDENVLKQHYTECEHHPDKIKAKNEQTIKDWQQLRITEDNNQQNQDEEEVKSYEVKKNSEDAEVSLIQVSKTIEITLIQGGAIKTRNSDIAIDPRSKSIKKHYRHSMNDKENADPVGKKNSPLTPHKSSKKMKMQSKSANKFETK